MQNTYSVMHKGYMYIFFYVCSSLFQFLTSESAILIHIFLDY